MGFLGVRARRSMGHGADTFWRGAARSPLRDAPWGVLLPVTLIATVALSAPASAQQVPLPTPSGFEPGLGLQLGGIEFFTRLEAGVGATSNARKDPTEESDHLRTFEGKVRAQSTWDRHSLSAGVRHVDKRTIDIDQDSYATSGNLAGRIDLWESWSVNASVMHEEDLVEKHHPEQFIGNINGRTETDAASLGAKREDSDSLVSLTWTYQDVDNESEIDATNFQVLQNNDRQETDLTLQAGPKFDWGRAYVQGDLRRIDYTQSPTVGTEDFDSHGYKVGFGLEYQQGSLSGLFTITGFRQDYETDTIGDIQGVTTTTELLWQARDNLVLGTTLSRTFSEQATAGSAGLYSNVAAAGVMYQPLDYVYLRLEPSYTYFRQQGVGNSAENVRLTGTAAWQVHDRVELLLKGDMSRQTANDAALNSLEFDDATVTLSTVVTF